MCINFDFFYFADAFCPEQTRHETPFQSVRLDVSHDSYSADILLSPDAMHSADYAVARCPPVCLSDAGILSKWLNTSSVHIW